MQSQLNLQMCTLTITSRSFQYPSQDSGRTVAQSKGVIYSQNTRVDVVVEERDRVVGVDGGGGYNCKLLTLRGLSNVRH